LSVLLIGALCASTAPVAQADELAPYRNPAYAAAFQELLTAKWPNQFSAAETALGTTGIDLNIRDGLFRTRGEARTFPRLGVTDVLNFHTDRPWRVYVNSNVGRKFARITGDPGFGTTGLNADLQGVRWAASCRTSSCPDMGSSFPSTTLPPSARGWWVLNWRYQSPGWSSRLWRCPAYGWTPSNHFCYQKDVDAWKWFGEPNEFHVGGALLEGKNDDGSTADCDTSSAVEPCYYRLQSVLQMGDRMHVDRFENWTNQTYEADTDFRPYPQTYNAVEARDELDRGVNADARAWINHQLDPSYADPRAPSIVTWPTLSGPFNANERAASAPGIWTNSPTTYTHNWLRCDASGASCVAVPLAETAGYTVSSADIGYRLKVRVAATNAYGTSTADSAASPPVLVDVSDLILRYRPHILLDSQEPWRPISIPTFLDERQEDGAFAHRVCLVSVGDCVNGSPDAAIRDNNSAAFFLDISGSGNVDDYASPDPECHELVGSFTTSDCGSGTRSAIYVSVAEDATGLEFLDYWWFVRYNDVPGWIGSGLDDHEGDWEGMTVVIDAMTSSTEPQIAWVDYSQHGADEWEMGAVPGSTGTHIHVFSARGTHASYDSECYANINACPAPHSPGGLYWEESYDGRAPWGNNSDSLCASQCVLRLWSTDQWAFWSGKWGAQKSVDSPGLQPRFQCAANGYSTCDRNFGGRAARPSDRRLFKRCKTWASVGVAATACDERLLGEAITKRRTHVPGALHLSAMGRRSGNAPGLAQLIGGPLRQGEVVRVDGASTANTTLTLHVILEKRLYELHVRGLGRSGVHTRLRMSQQNHRPIVVGVGPAAKVTVRKISG